MMRLIDAETVDRLLPVPELARRIGAAFTASGAEAAAADRSALEAGPGRLLLMPARYGDTLAVKLITLFDNPPERRLPSVQGVVTVFSALTGEPLALVDAAALTRVRTAAVTVLATDLLARRDARTLTVVGAGVQALGHLEGLAGIRPWDRVLLHGRDQGRARELAARVAPLGLDVEVVPRIDEALREADVICTTTTSPTPLFDAGLSLRPGVHISAVGAYGAERRELPSALVAGSRLFVESREAVLREAGDIVIPVAEGALPERPDLTELGELLTGAREGRRSDTETTLFKSVGLPVEDAYTCDLLHRLTRRDAPHGDSAESTAD
ncbi:ornithine cyclodeaminase family protein [Streptomyces sp. JJ38]|uniref:ornithine cyclodeaminase family protein n=1 Tax=Streptomyces sp. JJ38 TaxID=2738128 RepID=UPI001C587C05|nr:ornithine cyclodeaminase family protein [Streptomyces sp. JJ38]MBW1598464.1 ornithine cyclodeaminase family protein [Streptomyces sp. JJ38]